MTDLILTPAAHALISKLAAIRGRPRAGLRIAMPDAQTLKLSVAMTDSPWPGDIAVVHGNARVYCESGAASHLHGMRLDVRRDARGRLEFRVDRDAHLGE
jgi:Fe-S cluster assembly iron-binding protein IscA